MATANAASPERQRRAAARVAVSAAPVDEMRLLVAYDWLVTRAWNRLHWADLTPDQLARMDDDRQLWEPVRLACGRTAAYVSIPGILTRIGAQRCTGCCRALGYPQGKGSPRNDNECRRLLGLDQS